MNDCNFNTPDRIARYFENKMTDVEKQNFEKHLIGCSTCMEALLSLEKDLFLMQNSPFKKLPQRLRIKKAIFNIAENGIELLKNIMDIDKFSPVSYAPARGESPECAISYILRKGNVSLEIMSKGRKNFLIEIVGSSLKEIKVYRNKILIDAIILKVPRSVTIEDLTPGNYSIWINNQKFTVFEVR